MKAIQAYPHQGLGGLTLVDFFNPGKTPEFEPGDQVVPTFFPTWLAPPRPSRPHQSAGAMPRQQRLQVLIVSSRRHQLDLIRGVDAVHGHPVIDRSFPLVEIADAFRLQETGGHFGKIVIEY